MSSDAVRRAVEALLLVSDKPLDIAQIREASEAEPAAIREALETVARELDEARRGFRLKELAGGWQLVTDPDTAGIVRKYIQSKEKKRVSQAGLETLSIVAYRQPITKAEIEFIRGVNVDGSLKTLIEKGLVRISGRKEVPGRPILYSTTKDFLDHFGLGSLKELPRLAEFTEKDIELPLSMIKIDSGEGTEGSEDVIAPGQEGQEPAAEAAVEGEEAPPS